MSHDGDLQRKCLWRVAFAGVGLICLGGAPALGGAASLPSLPGNVQSSGGGDVLEIIPQFEAWSNRLCSSEGGRVDEIAASLREHPDSRLLIFVPVPPDMGERRFVLARLGAVEAELVKRGLAGEKISVSVPRGGGAQIILRVAASPSRRKPVEILAETGTEAIAPAAVVAPGRAIGAGGGPLPLVAPSATAPDRSNPPTALPVLIGWHLRGAVPGRAWVVAPGEERLGPVEIKEGDVHPVLGRIQRISRDGDRWVVQAAKGRVEGGPS